MNNGEGAGIVLQVQVCDVGVQPATAVLGEQCAETWAACLCDPAVFLVLLPGFAL